MNNSNPSKPVFLTKAQREQLALQRLEEQRAQQKRRLEELHRSNNSSSNNNNYDLTSTKPSSDSSDRRDRERQRERDRESERRNREREREREREEEAKARERARLEKLAERERGKELDAIKEQYLGSKKPKKRVIKPSEKFRFSFDWENTEDTSRDMNSLYQNPHEAQLLFGRGFRAGMDRREQKKLAAKNEKEMREEVRRKEGIEEKPEEAAAQRLKEEAANTYDTFDMRVDKHWSDKKLEEMTERDWRIFREDFNISYKGSKIPRPVRSWNESKLSAELLKAVERVGYKKPSPIQMAAIPLGLQQRDVIGVAETGSGKTAAFVLPMLSYISRLPPMSEENEAEGPYAVVMAPTRELAQQIEDETMKFAHYLGIKVVSIVGGQSIEEQGFRIRQGCEVVIATPGRLLDCLERRYAVLNQCNYVVLDEADRMIDMGFEPQVVGVLEAMPSSNLKPENEDEELDEKRIYRTTYMFSATMPPAVERLARKYLRNPVVVTIGTAGKATDLISQHVIMMKESEKFPRLQKLLNDLGDKTAIVFVNTKKNADTISKNLDKAGYRVTTLHGGRSQEQREISLEGFRAKRFNVLVATDVAGRGIDIPDVAHVINYDMPSNIEMYTHRIGRTGRAGKTGVATTFLTLHDTDVFFDLKQMLIQNGSPVPSFEFQTELAKGIQPLDGPNSIKGKFKFHLIKKPLGWKKGHCFQTNTGNDPVVGLLLWQGAIQKDLKEIGVELHQIKTTSCFQNLDFLILQLKFLVNVLIFYSNALEKLFYPVLVDVSNIQLSLLTQDLYIASHTEHLQNLLHYTNQKGMPANEYVEKLCQKLESFVMNVDKQFSLQEKEVFPVIRNNCSKEMQRQLLCMSLLVMPLGLLKCVVTWFAARLSEDESRLILQIINEGNSLINKSLASLLLEWFHIGYSGKTSVEYFRRDLEKMFSCRCSLLPVSIEEDAESSSFLSDMSLCKGSESKLIKAVFVNKRKKGFSFSSASSHVIKHFETSYCNGINLHIFFPKTIKDLYPFANFPGEKSCVDYAIDEPIPMDLIFFFHRALKKDLDYLVLGSDLLAENVAFLPEFHQRFHLIQLLYQIHSDAEDEVAFPALEVKGKCRNISHSYSLDHKIEVENFSKISLILDEIYDLHIRSSSGESVTQDTVVKHQQLCIDLQDSCKSMHKLLSDHVHREEVELWPLFRECFSIKEQEKIIGNMLGRTGADILHDMIPWLMASLTPDEQNTVMSLWHNATSNTMFDEWLGEWWEGHKRVKEAEESATPSWTADPLEIISTYFPRVLDEPEAICDNCLRPSSIGADIELLGMPNIDGKVKAFKGDEKCSECSVLFGRSNDKQCNEAADLMGRSNEPGQKSQVTQNSGQCNQLQTMSQEDLEAAIRRVSSDTSLDPERKSHVMQNLLMSRWILKQQISNLEVNNSNNGEDIPGQHPSYRDPLKLALGCKHYKRNCKLFAACCNQLYTCIHCHNEVADHILDRKSVTKMMCMNCLVIQPIGSICSTVSCNNLSMGKYYCRICKLFDDERQIYHCPYCNLCRVGKGLGIDYFHCMNCNACMSRSLSLHICREKSFEDNCPICHEDIFTSTSPVKALPCGHMMHSACFQEYTCTHYTCPICSKSLGDMQVYFKMLDALLAEEKFPDEYQGRTQVILCNDCEKKGTAPFHWLYHKCSNCGSYNTRLL